MSEQEPEPQDAPAETPEAPPADEPTPVEDEPTSTPPDTGPLDIPTDPGEPDEDAVTGPTTIEGDDEDGEGEGEPAEPAEPTGNALNEKEVEKRLEKVKRENQRHTSRISEILEDDATSLIPCPVCAGFVDGWIFNPDLAPVSDDAKERVAQVLGIIDTTEHQHSSRYETCPECLGLGEVLTGSKVPGFDLVTCELCHKNGYITPGAPTNGHVHVLEAPKETGPNIYLNDESSDPEIQHLRERGFTVIPPMPALARG